VFGSANHYLVATATHNLQDDNGLDLQISDFDVRPRGEKFGEPLEVRSIGMAPNSDLAWLELGRKASKRPQLAFVTIDQIASLQEEKDQQPCFLLGYPKERAEKPTDPK
jgi:hypothetical protein